MQMLDEVPMIWGSCYMIYTMHLVLKKPGSVSYKAATFLLLYCLVFLVVYTKLDDPLLFQTMYGVVVVVLVVQAMYIFTLQCNKQVFKLYMTGLVLYLTGFILWNIGKNSKATLVMDHQVNNFLENHHCSTLTRWRCSLPHILQPVLQLHAWWHLLAGYATYLNIQHCLHHRATFLQRQVDISLNWVGVTVIMDRDNKRGKS